MKDAVKAICRIWRPEWQGMLMGRLTYKKKMEKIKRMRKSSAMGNFSAWPSAAGKAGNFLSSSFQNLLLPKKERSGPMKPPSGNHFQQMKSELTAKRLATIMKSITQRNPSSADFRFLNP